MEKGTEKPMEEIIGRIGKGSMVTERLTMEDRFNFLCHKGLECFMYCCGKIAVFLTPYDVLRIKNRLGLTSGDFMQKYAEAVELENVRLPFIMLKMDEERGCPFISGDGCDIYDDRPLVCRYYPVGLGMVKRTKEGGGDFFFLIKEPFCKGFNENKEWTLRQWRETQEINLYDAVNKDWFDTLLTKRLVASNLVPNEKSQQLYMLCSFDIDGFRRFVFESRFLEMYDVDDDTVEFLRKDEAELLQFAHRWLRGVLFGNPAVKLREG